jgi:glutaredoxin
VKPLRLTLYSRANCHLCDDMLAALNKLRGEFSFEVTVIDVDSAPALVATYDELVPLLEAEGNELCRYFFDEAVVRQHLRTACMRLSGARLP